MHKSRIEFYIGQQLASSGFVLCEPAIAYKLRKDIWPSGQSCGLDFLSPSVKAALANMANIMFKFEGSGVRGFGGAATMTRLVERIHEVTGLNLEVEAITRADLLGEAKTTQAALAISNEHERKERERIEKLKALAAQEPPTHDCAHKREILIAREKLARMEVEAHV
jgi:hypothetical protein